MDEVKANAAKGGFNIEGVEIIDPATYPEMDKMVDKMVELRKGKMTPEDCRKALSKGNYFGTMLVKMGYDDSLLGGSAAGEDQEGGPSGVLLLHPDPRRGEAGHGRLRHQPEL